MKRIRNKSNINDFTYIRSAKSIIKDIFNIINLDDFKNYFNYS